jgi:4-amino-4-deoxy-L-arabinose transferase-like glycosyltransferase
MTLHSDDRAGAPGTRRFLRLGLPPSLIAAAVLLLFTLGARAIGWGPSVINPDESIFSLAAREVTAGHLPYLTLFDNKPVGSTLILASGFALFGQSVLVVRLIGAAFAFASGMLVAALLRGGGFGRREALSAGIVQIAYASALGLGGQATLTELLLAPFTVLAVLLLRRLAVDERPGRRAALAGAAGLACGVAVLIKIVPILPGLAVAGATLLLLLVRRRVTPKSAALLFAAFAAGAVAPMLVAAGVYAATGALDAFLWSNFGFAGAYAGIHPRPAMMAQRLGTAVDALWPLLALCVVALSGAVAAWRKERRVDDLLLIALAWVVAEVIAASASLQFFPHYFLTAVPALAVLSAYGVRVIAGWIGAARPGRVALVLGGLAALVAVERTQVDMARERLATPDVPAKVAAAIRRAAPDRALGRAPTLFVTNYKLSGIYFLTGSPLPPTRFAIPAHLFSRQSAMTRADPQAEVARVIASRPEFIVFDDVEPLPAWARARFDGVAADYRPFQAVGTVRVLRRTGFR